MADDAPTLYFDFVDPLSYLMEVELRAAGFDALVARAPFELRPPPAPLVELADAAVAERWDVAREVAAELGIALAPPRLVPWSRKAHELHLLATSRARDAEVRRAVYDAYMLEGRDIGRIDVLVDIARAAGLDPTETKATLDVDRHEAEVADARRAAAARGVVEPPVLLSRAGRLEGFHNRAVLGTFLRDS